MKALTFTIELLQPLLATGLEGDANIGISLNYIAGSVLRGAIVGLSPKKNDIARQERDLFFNGKVKFLNAYPLINSVRALPVPLSWQRHKDEKEEDGKNFKDFSKAEKEKDHKNLSNPFFAFKRGDVILKKSDTRLAIHTTRNVEKGRSDEVEGAVFRYESIVEGTKFGGAILSENEELLKDIKTWIDGKKVLLGGSRNAGYGKSEIVCDADIKDWQEPQVPEAKEIESGQPLTITLLSNALVRDGNGQFQTDLTAESLGLNAADVLIVADKTFKRGELVGGFNRKWGLPLPQTLSVKAGSVFKFTAQVKIEKDKIEGWLKQGIGERTLDGFGRVAVNLHTKEDYKITKAESETASMITLSAEGKKIGESLAEKIIKRRFEADLSSKVLKYKIKGGISNSQISRIRLYIREMLRGEKENFGNFFSNLKSKASEQFESAEVSGEKHQGRLKNWIIDVFTNQDILSANKVSFGNSNKAEADGEKFKRKFHLLLIDGVLAKKAKESKNNVE